MARGAHACRDLVDVFSEQSFPERRHMIRGYDAHVFYGLEGHLPRIFEAALAESTAVYVDLGYWGRRAGGRYQGYHKVTVNARHPTSYFREPPKPRDRFRKLGLAVKPWRHPEAGETVLLAGMGAKGAAAERMYPQMWELHVRDQLLRHTGRPIVYRPKPSDPLAAPMPGTIYSPKDKPLEEELARAWAVVTHHSNVAVDALLAGVPVFCEAGVAREMGCTDLSKIEMPIYPEDREQWAADLAYTQWTVAEMASGACWEHLKNDGLV